MDMQWCDDLLLLTLGYIFFVNSVIYKIPLVSNIFPELAVEASVYLSCLTLILVFMAVLYARHFGYSLPYPQLLRERCLNISFTISFIIFNTFFVFIMLDLKQPTSCHDS